MWVPDPSGDHLTLLGGWSQAASELLEFASTSRQFTFYPDAGLPGRIGKAASLLGFRAWPTIATSCATRWPARQVSPAGLAFRRWLAIQTVAVLVIFSREARERDADLLRADAQSWRSDWTVH